MTTLPIRYTVGPTTGRVLDRAAPNLALCLITLALCSACAARTPKPKYIYGGEEFRAELTARVPNIPKSLLAPPYRVSPAAIELAYLRTEEAPKGPARVNALLKALQTEAPDGFGLQYDWKKSATAQKTLDAKFGNCMSLASVLVGLGRGLGWPIYYAVASGVRPETYEIEDVSVVVDHMVVIIAAKTFQVVVDFTGEVEAGYTITPIDDLTAYAHFINNVGGGVLIDSDGFADEEWERALEAFRLSAQIDPELARAWNNAGIALSRLGRVDEARVAYAKATEIDPDLRSVDRNLSILETRADQEGAVSPEIVREIDLSGESR